MFRPSWCLAQGAPWPRNRPFPGPTDSRLIRRPKIVAQVVRQDAATAAAQASTSSTVFTIDDKTLRSCAQNSAAIALLFLGDNLNGDLLELAMWASRPVMSWHTGCERQVRNVDGASAWLRAQLDGQFFDHLTEVWKSLSPPGFFGGVGLLSFQFAAENDLSAERILEDDEKTGMAGQTAMNFISSRLVRAMWMLGNYRVALTRLASDDPAIANQALQLFKGDYEIWKRLKVRDRPGTIWRAMIERSPFLLVAVQQVVEALKESS